MAQNLSHRFYKFGSWLSQTVKSQTIFCILNFFRQYVFKLLKLSFIDEAFEHRLLNTLSVGLTGFSYSTQATTTFGCFGADIVCYKYFQNYPPNDTKRVDNLLTHFANVALINELECEEPNLKESFAAKPGVQLLRIYAPDKPPKGFFGLPLSGG